MLDGEIVASSFDTLGQRIHPAKSRIERLSVETPARLVAFDLLALDDDVLLERPYHERRGALEAAALEGIELTPVVWTASEAQDWLLNEEGVIAKEADAPYLPGERTGMVKIKRVRTIDAVVVGWRPGKLEGTVGALILGLYAPDGNLRGVGHTSGFTAKEKRELPAKLAPYETGERGTGEPSRWSAGRDLSWVGLRPELVVEVTFDHVERRPHPPRREGPALARGQGARGVHGGPTGAVALRPRPAPPGRRSRRSHGAAPSRWP